MEVMALPSEVMLTYADFAALPDDGVRRELLEGEIVVSPSPNTRHQNVLGRLFVAFANHLAVHGGGQVFVAPYDVVLDEHTVVEPDLVFLGDTDLDIITEANVQGVPTLVAEVVSHSRTDRVRKRDLYSRHGIGEYWVVDPDADRVEVSRLTAGGGETHTYPKPELFEVGERVSPGCLPALFIELDQLFR
jgi:Uma2 family endonuclease